MSQPNSRPPVLAWILGALVVTVVGTWLWTAPMRRGPAVPSAPREPAAVRVTGVSDRTGTDRRFPYYCQGDPAWGDVVLGESGGNLASVGCTVSSVAMGLGGLGHPIDPGTLCRRLSAANGFTRSGLLIWSAVKEVTGGRIEVGVADLEPGRIDRELEAGRPVVARILLRGRFNHWILVIDRDERGYLALDPLSGDPTPVPVASLDRSIRAIRVFRVRGGSR